MNKIQISANFQLREFQCKDGSYQVGFNGVGVYGSFTHVDVREVPSRWSG